MSKTAREPQFECSADMMAYDWAKERCAEPKCACHRLICEPCVAGHHRVFAERHVDAREAKN